MCVWQVSAKALATQQGRVVQAGESKFRGISLKSVMLSQLKGDILQACSIITANFLYSMCSLSGHSNSSDLLSHSLLSQKNERPVKSLRRNEEEGKCFSGVAPSIF